MAIDFDFQDHGTIALIVPKTAEAEAYADTVFAGAMHHGNAIACEPRYAMQNAFDLQCDGFTIAINGKECELQPT